MGGGLQKFQMDSMEWWMESMEWGMDSMWNPWNQCWLRPQPIHGSMDIMDSIWNDHGMINSIWNVGISTMDSMDKSIWIPWNVPYR